MFRIYPYKMGSASVRKLKEVLGALIIRLEGTRYRKRANHIVINWGNSTRPDWMTDDDNVLNLPESVALASNKLSTFETLEEHGVATVPYTTASDVATGWLNSGSMVFARHTLTGHSGEGIEIVTPQTELVYTPEQQERIDFLTDVQDVLREENENGLVISVNEVLESIEPEGVTSSTTLPDAPLYTQAVENNGEYRVHVFGGEVILYQKKSRKVNEDGEVETAEGEDSLVRNLASNWVYRVGNLRRLERVEELAKNAIDALGLDFGAVDIIKDENGEVYVLEVNTAVGLGNESTIEAYTEAFNQLY